MFGYGSLVGAPDHLPARRWSPGGFVADLLGFRRAWGVAMDNRRDLPGYKYYTDTAGRRPEVFVAFLDVRPAASPAAGEMVNGVCLPVDDAQLAVLDQRERNYDRIDVSHQIRIDGEDRGDGLCVWTYAGSAAGRDRLRTGVAAGTAVIDANYLASVRDGFARLGRDEHRAGTGSLEPGDLPVVALVRHEL